MKSSSIFTLWQAEGKVYTAEEIEQLQQAGISEGMLSYPYAPVGLPIGSHTPEEIAISIASQILQQREVY